MSALPLARRMVAAALTLGLSLVTGAQVHANPIYFPIEDGTSWTTLESETAIFSNGTTEKSGPFVGCAFATGRKWPSICSPPEFARFHRP